MKSAKPEETQLAPAEPTQLPATTMPVVNLQTLLDKALDSKAAMEVVSQLRQMLREEKADAAKAAFDEAMSAFQSECPVITKEKGVPDRSGKIAYRYAPLEIIEAQIRPILRKHGFSHTFDTDTASVNGWVIAKCIVTHRAGHSRESSAKFPLGTKTQLMSETQVYAAALTFANRRALQNAYGLVLAGEDFDGATGKLKPMNPNALKADVEDDEIEELRKELWVTLEPVRGDQKNWNKCNAWLWKQELLDAAKEEYLPNISAERYKEVIAKAKDKLKNP